MLSQGFLESLLEKSDIKIVLFVLEHKRSYYEKEFQRERVKIVGIDRKCQPFGSRFFRELSFLLLRTNTMRISLKSRAIAEDKYGFFFLWSFLSRLGSLSFCRFLFRLLVNVSSRPFFDSYFETLRPSLVVSLDVKHSLDAQMIIEASKKNINTMGMVRSWDNLTAKGILRALPKIMIVHNEIIKREAVSLSDMPAEDIIVVGIPHYDIYINENRSPREVFCASIGADPKKTLVIFGPIGSNYSSADKNILADLEGAVKDGRLPKDLQFIVRFPPGDTADVADFKGNPLFVFDRPGMRFSSNDLKDTEMTHKDSRHLADSLYHAAAIVAGPSTLLIDALAFDKPTIALGYDGSSKKLPFYKSARRYFDYDHMSTLIKTKAVSLAESSDSLIEALSRALLFKDEKKQERLKAVYEQCGPLDGKASRRLALSILRQLR